jgi:pseudouridine-5'-phosphate glycosidase
MLKSSSRDLAIAIAFGKSAATTISASIHLAAMAGIKFFVTSGLDGTRRNSSDTFDESADFTALSTLDITVVCGGVKSIIDIEASLANLKSLDIDIIGYQTDKFPGFYLTHSDFAVEKQAESASEIASVIKNRNVQKTKSSALIVANPVKNQMDRTLHDSILSSALALAEKDAITGKALAAHLLEHFHTSSNGESLRLDIEIIKSNASLASEIAKI